MLQKIEGVLAKRGGATISEIAQDMNIPGDFAVAMVSQLKALGRIEEVGCSSSAASSSCASSCGGCSFAPTVQYRLKD
ncbi:Ferrous iron transport protein C [Pseudovibrio axinellae]|uniref:Ferrous iron transport protein C n=1 Tax=Pseudovibrio axinellae TaxID=989403 RepID=A0A165T5A3_9HYPH|nr:FeoC-like transcriptional regulator [Pseudovibrio axinellae]KZL05452.1 Ferrous iron transport protein C [Pseudovibrio axinellae]SEP98612.1 ferrous iron transport protein C [Pseudovibrio axinellae]